MSLLSRLGEALHEVFGDRAVGTDASPQRWSSREERISRALIALATAWFVVAASWELFGPILAGHYASSASMGIIAENMHRWHIIAPVWVYTDTKPTPDLYYCHHPWGIFWTTRIFYEVFGRHDFVCRLPAVVLSSITPALLAATSRALYRPYAGALTAIAFVVLPITLSFASFNALEVPVMAHSALFLWGYVRMLERPRRRYLLASLVGAVLALNADWPAFVLVGALLGAELLRLLFFRPSPRAELDRRRAQWWGLTATAAVLTMAMYLYLFRDAGKLDDLLGSYGMRSAGNQMPLSKVLEGRRYWIELMFTPVAVVLGKVMAIVCVIRLIVRRRMVDVVPLAVLAMATVQYVVFKEGADLHVFWPHYFAAYYALAVGAALPTLAGLVRIATRRAARVAARAEIVAMTLLGLGLLFVLRDGVQVWLYAHRTGGRFNEKGNRIQSDGDKIALLGWLHPRLRVGLHESMDANWADVWALGGRSVVLSAGPPSAGSDGVTIADARFVSDAERVAWLKTYAVTMVGPFWVLRAAPPSATVLGFSEREPSFFERAFVSGTEPRRRIGEAAYAAWEVEDHYGLAATVPPSEATTLEEHRIRYNIAIASSDPDRAIVERRAIASRCKPLDGTFSDGTRLEFACFEDGVAPRLTVMFETNGPLAAGVEMAVRSRVVERAWMSTTMPDPTVRETGFPFVLAPSLFKRGYLYGQPIVVRFRPGTEVFEATFRGRGAPTIDTPVEVLRR